MATGEPAAIKVIGCFADTHYYLLFYDQLSALLQLTGLDVYEIQACRKAMLNLCGSCDVLLQEEFTADVTNGDGYQFALLHGRDIYKEMTAC